MNCLTGVQFSELHDKTTMTLQIAVTTFSTEALRVVKQNVNNTLNVQRPCNCGNLHQKHWITSTYLCTPAAIYARDNKVRQKHGSTLHR